MAVGVNKIALTPNRSNSFEKYEPLLYKIATNLDFSDNESYDLMYQVKLHVINHSFNSNLYGFKTWCLKMMVHKCIFRISQNIVNRQRFPEPRPRVLEYPRTSATNIHDLYLSLRVVYVLKQIIRVDDIEIAEILNITPIEVKKKFDRAISFLNR